MVAVSFVLVLALVSSTVVALLVTDVFIGLFARFKQQPTLEPPEIPTESVHRWIPLEEETSTPTSGEDPADIGLSYILQQLNIQPDEFTKRTNFTDRFGVTHLSPTIPESTIKASSEDAVKSPTIPESTVNISPEDAVKAAVDCLGVPFYRDTTPHHSVFTVILTAICPIYATVSHLIVVNPGDIVSKEDVKREFIYTAIELPNENPRDGFSTIVNPENLQASPNGWTDGFELKETMLRPNLKNTGHLERLLEAVTNMVHDITYQYGFNEPAGNFQQDNFGRGGIGGDSIIINLQNSKRKNYVSFDTLPDGHPGVLNLHISTATKPNRDPALDNTLMIHELTHGVSSRLTGGAQTKMCMSKIECGGLSEGYSDVIAIIFTAKPEDTRNTEKVIGEYVEDSQGIRRYPYTTDMKVNPLKYKDAVGEKRPIPPW
ncbi:hypothetical protein BSLG_010745 [Batrachochytrium salamandrivorans]|nr:hypothetical protein BSLG_010745 [Batrachochytrium salamandrivorans]